jgi:hypothetical protein
MAYYIFLKSLRSLEEFRKNPHVKIPSKSPSTNFQSLDKFKNLIFNSEILFPYFRPDRPCGPLSLWPSHPAGLAAPQAETPPHRPIQPVRRWRLCRNTFSLLVHAFWACRLSLVSLSSGPRLSAPFLIFGRPSSPMPPPLFGHPALPSSAPRVPPSHYHPAFIFPP